MVATDDKTAITGVFAKFCISFAAKSGYYNSLASLATKALAAGWSYPSRPDFVSRLDEAPGAAMNYV